VPSFRGALANAGNFNTPTGHFLLIDRGPFPCHPGSSELTDPTDLKDHQSIEIKHPVGVSKLPAGAKVTLNDGSFQDRTIRSFQLHYE